MTGKTNDSTAPLELIVLTPHGEAVDVHCDSVHLTVCDDETGHGGGQVGFHRGHLPAVLALGDGPADALLHGEADPTFGSGRIYIWKNVWEAICARPWFGGGPDTLAHQVSAYFERYDADANRILRATIDAAHNEYLNIWADQGVFALLCWLGALGASAVRFVRRADEEEMLICGSAVLGYCIQAFFGISTCISAPYLFLAWAMLEGQREPLQDKIEKTIIGGWKR